MIISKTFTLDKNVGSGQSISVPGASSVTNYPIVSRFIVDGLNDILANFNHHIEYNETTGQAVLDGVTFYIVANLSNIQMYFRDNSEIGYNSIYASFSGNTKAYRMTATVRGDDQSFEIYIAAGLDLSNVSTMVGKYAVRRLSDGKILTAFRKNNSDGCFWVYEDGQFLEYSAVIKPATTYAYSSNTYSGYALLPAVMTNFAYQLVNAFLYCPALQSGNHYTIAGINTVSVQSCVLLKC